MSAPKTPAEALERLVIYTAMQDGELAYACEEIIKAALSHPASGDGGEREGWRPMDDFHHRFLPVIIGRVPDAESLYSPCTAFKDVTGAWRIFRAPETALHWEPTHWMPLPAAPQPSGPEGAG